MTFRAISKSMVAIFGVTLWLLAVPVVQAGDVYHLANGIRATVYGPTEISEQWMQRDGEKNLVSHPAAGYLVLADDADIMVPFEAAVVVDALAAMQGFTTRLDVDVFILPATPLAVGSSFARRGAIYLAPGNAPTASSTVAYITTHEMGHVLSWAFLDGQPRRWEAYLALRGLDASALGGATRHADRAREILAEDIRHLFGGALATSTGTIENHNLVLPDRVEGLEPLLADYFESRRQGPQRAAATAFPNPCNPMTTIEMALPLEGAGVNGSAMLRIFDLRGNLVSTVSGGYVANGTVAIKWKGTDQNGGAVASGRYLYTLSMGSVVGRGSVTLVR